MAPLGDSLSLTAITLLLGYRSAPVSAAFRDDIAIVLNSLVYCFNKHHRLLFNRTPKNKGSREFKRKTLIREQG